MARKRESNFWDRVRPLLAGLDPVRVENAVNPGTPDVNCILGWIELKQIRPEDMPKRAGTVLRLDHFTPEQRAWLTRRAYFGGACWVLLLLGEQWVLIVGRTAAEHLGRVNVADTLALASHVWPTKPSAEELQKALRDTGLVMALGGKHE